MQLLNHNSDIIQDNDLLQLFATFLTLLFKYFIPLESIPFVNYDFCYPNFCYPECKSIGKALQQYPKLWEFSQAELKLLMHYYGQDLIIIEEQDKNYEKMKNILQNNMFAMTMVGEGQKLRLFNSMSEQQKVLSQLKIQYNFDLFQNHIKFGQKLRTGKSSHTLLQKIKQQNQVLKNINQFSKLKDLQRIDDMRQNHLFYNQLRKTDITKQYKNLLKINKIDEHFYQSVCFRY